MNSSKTSRRDVYYTNDHEWIDFQGSVAYVGICRFKLTGFKEVSKIKLAEPGDFIKKGDLIATVMYKDYIITAAMPVNGRLIQINSKLSEEQNILAQDPENSGWIAMIAPSQPYDRDGLMIAKQYQLNGKGKYAK
jgi:glycine cleavage system H protein